MNGVVLDANVALDWFLESSAGDTYSLGLEALGAGKSQVLCA